METLIRKTKHFTDNKRGFYRPYHSPLLKPRQITQTIFEFFSIELLKIPPIIIPMYKVKDRIW